MASFMPTMGSNRSSDANSQLFPYMNIQPDQSTDGTVPETELWEKFNGHVNTISDSQIDENGNLV